MPGSDLPPAVALADRVTALVSATAAGRVVVVGSLPPHGRDLDLLVRRPERERLERALADAGLEARNSMFVLFAGCSAFAVELIAAEDYLDPGPVEDLFSSAQPLPAAANLAQPAPAHALLILARLVEEEALLRPKRRARLQRILAADPGAWEKARAAAPRWGATAALERLRRAAAEELPPSHLALVSSCHHRAFLTRSLTRRVYRRLGRLRPRGGHVLVSFSGIDGSGKSSQARWLADALAALGIEAEVIWNDLLGNFAMDLIGRPVKALLRLLGRERPRMARYEEDNDHAQPSTGSDSADQRGHFLRGLWGTFVTLSNALEQRVLCARALSRGRVVIFDRGPLDLAVRMEVLYGAGIGWQRRIVRLAAPRPDLAFLLEIPPELSLERKDDVWSLAQLRRHAALYDELGNDFRVRRLDARRASEDLAAEIGRAVWQRLA